MGNSVGGITGGFLEFLISPFRDMEKWCFFFALALVAMLIVGAPMIGWLKRLPGMKWSAREDTPDTHLQKHGTPSMGGIGIIGSALLSFLSLVSIIVAVGKNSPGISIDLGLFVQIYCILPAYVFLHMVLGWIDDTSKAKGKGGLRARDKFLGQCLLSAVFLAIVVYLGATQPASRMLMPRLIGNGGLLSIVVLLSAAMVLLLGTCNAVNITDGIDGLAAGLSVMFGVAVALASGWSDNSLPWASLAGACLGFLCFNRYPARVFMGDTGSLALGAAVGGVAVMTHSLFLLPFIGFIFYVELLSVTIQVLYFKWTRKKTGEGKRLFRRAPLHHHFELGGWTEWRVVGTFWLVNLFTTAIGLILWFRGIIPRFP